jgi:outer membrane protein OmpA-like peptidoglycan-associated protein
MVTIQQVDYGPQARFTACIGSSCARPTVKTLDTGPSDHKGVLASTRSPAPRAASPGAIAPPATTSTDEHATAPLVSRPVPPTEAALPVVNAATESPVQALPSVAALPAAPSAGEAVTTRTALASAAGNPTEPMSSVRATTASVESEAEERIVVHFRSGSVELTPEAKAIIRSTLPRLAASDRIVIAGRTDWLGDNEVNQAVALARAMAVRDYIGRFSPASLRHVGIDARGNCCFAASNDTRLGRSKNRRVEILMSSKGVA